MHNQTPIHSINIDVSSYEEAKDLFDYAGRRASKDKNRAFWVSVRNQAVTAMNILKDLEN
jgi:hypothetical protein